MKCPKCHYLSFDASDRCRNCGYDFSLSVSRSADADVTMDVADESVQPLDLTLSDHRIDGGAREEPAIDLDRLIGGPSQTLPDLPLFARDDRDDRPLIAPPATPRAPLAVRRTVDTARMRSVKRRHAPPDLALDLAPSPSAVIEDETPARIAVPAAPPAGWIRRTAAATLDMTILAAIDAIVVYFTVKLCGLSLTDLPAVPVVPLLAFLVMLNGGYLIAFTAMGGQTIGKMASGIQVIRDEGPVDFAHAALRAAAYVVSLVPAGLGLIPAFFGDGRRALHDRLADTRVVRA